MKVSHNKNPVQFNVRTVHAGFVVEKLADFHHSKFSFPLTLPFQQCYVFMYY